MKNKIIIHEPIWKNQSIGLCEHKLTDITLVEIDYLNRDGLRLFPNTYSITREKALSYPIQMVKGNRLRIVPINDLVVKNETY